MPLGGVLLAALVALICHSATAADLVIWWNKGFYEQEDDAIREIVAAFEQETGKKVELAFHPQDEMGAQVDRTFKDGQTPDFVWWPLGFNWIPAWAYEDRLIALDSTLKDFVDLFDADTIDEATLLNGRTGKRALYGLPMGRTSFHIHVWKSLLEQAGFTLDDIPKRWDDFWSFWCDQVHPAVRTATGRTDIWAVGLPMSVDGIDTDDQVMQFQLARESAWVAADRHLQIDEPAVRQGMSDALQNYAAVWRKNCTPPDSATWDGYGNNKAFLDQRVVMTLNATLSIPGELRTARPEDYYENAVTIDWPIGANGQTIALVAIIQRGVLLKDGGNGELGKEFVRFLVEDGWLAHWLSFAGDRYLPPMRKLVEQPFWLDLNDPHRLRAAIQALSQPHVNVYAVRGNEWRSTRLSQERVWAKAVHQVVTDDVSPQQAVDEAIARIKEVLNE
jgi:multiple sugar transport system substrate-binding protein